MYTIVGTCSICGGPVQIPTLWSSVLPPTKTCGACGAVARDNYGPTIPMQPSTRTIVSKNSA